MQAWRLQQEALRLGGAGESRPRRTAVFVLERDWLLIPVVTPPPLPVPPPPTLLVVFFFPSLLAWMEQKCVFVCVCGGDGEGGGWMLMSHDVQGVVR